MPDSVPRVLAILPGLVASTWMDVVRPLLMLQQMGRIQFRAAVDFAARPSLVDWADGVVFCRNVDPRYSYLLQRVLQRSKPYIYDLDDNFFDVPMDTELGRYYRAEAQQAFLRAYLSYADLVRVYSPVLQERVRPWNAKAVLVSPPLNWSLILPPERRKGAPLRIVYATSRAEDLLSAIFLPAVQRVLKTYAGRVEAHFLGYFPPEMKNLDGVVHVPYQPNYDAFLQFFSRQGYDIGLAPLQDDVFHRSKTNNKFREYAACQVAGIYSDVDLYSDCVVNRQTGLLVHNDVEAWYAALVQLVEDETLRETIQKQAFEEVRQRYDEKAFAEVWWQQIQQVLSCSREARSLPMHSVEQGGMRRGRVRVLLDRLRAVGVAGAWRAVVSRLYHSWMLWRINVGKRL